MRVLVACEFTGTIRDEFLYAGHDAWSCDLLPTLSNPERHYVQDVVPLLRQRWDLVIAHPPCTYLCNTGVQHLFKGGSGDKWEALRRACIFFWMCLDANARYVCVENPTQHKYARRLIGDAPTCVVQPYEHGHPWSKRTCLWLRGLPPLVPTNPVPPTMTDYIHNMHGKNRWMQRAETPRGIAHAMLVQWGCLPL